MKNVLLSRTPLLLLPLAALAGCGLSQDRLLNTMDPDTWQRVCSHKRVAFDTKAIAYTCGETLIERPPITAESREQDCLQTYSASTTWSDCTATYRDFRALLRARTGEIEVEADATTPVDTGLNGPGQRPQRPQREPLITGPTTVTIIADPCQPPPLPTEVTQCVLDASR